MYPASSGTNLPTSAQLQEAASALAATAAKYTAVAEELVTVAAGALAAGQALTAQWRGKAPTSFLTSLDKLAGDVSNIAGALATSANAMLTLAEAIDSNAGAINSATQLIAQEPAHPSTGQAQQLSNMLVAANTALAAITAAANAATGQLDQVTGVGTCSTGDMRTVRGIPGGSGQVNPEPPPPPPDRPGMIEEALLELTAVDPFRPGYLEKQMEKELLGGAGGGSKPPGGPPPTTGGEENPEPPPDRAGSIESLFTDFLLDRSYWSRWIDWKVWTELLEGNGGEGGPSPFSGGEPPGDEGPYPPSR